VAPVRFFGGEEPPKALPRDARRLVAAGRCAHHRAPNRKASNAHCRARSWIDCQLMSTLSASLSSLLCFYHVSSGRLDNSTKTGSRWDTLWGITGTSCSWKPGTLELGESEDEDLHGLHGFIWNFCGDAMIKTGVSLPKQLVNVRTSSNRGPKGSGQKIFSSSHSVGLLRHTPH